MRVPKDVAALSALMVGAGVLHFVTPGFFDRVMPRQVPAPAVRPLTYASGVAEIASGVLLLHPSTRRTGARATAATLIGVFPANVDTVLAGGLRGVPGWLGTRQAAIARLPLQVPPVVAALRIARRAA